MYSPHIASNLDIGVPDFPDAALGPLILIQILPRHCLQERLRQRERDYYVQLTTVDQHLKITCQSLIYYELKDALLLRHA